MHTTALPVSQTTIAGWVVCGWWLQHAGASLMCETLCSSCAALGTLDIWRATLTSHACRYGSHVDWIPLEPWQTAINNPLEWSFSPSKAMMMCCPEIEFAKCYGRDIYTGINHTDIYLRQSQMTPDLPDPIGLEIAGVEGKTAQKAAYDQVNAVQQAAQQAATNQEGEAEQQAAQTVVRRHQQQPMETSDDDVAEV